MWDIFRYHVIWGVQGRADKERHIITSLYALRLVLIQPAAFTDLLFCLQRWRNSTRNTSFHSLEPLIFELHSSMISRNLSVNALNSRRDWNHSNLLGSKVTTIVMHKRLSAAWLNATSDKTTIIFRFQSAFSCLNLTFEICRHQFFVFLRLHCVKCNLCHLCRGTELSVSFWCLSRKQSKTRQKVAGLVEHLAAESNFIYFFNLFIMSVQPTPSVLKKQLMYKSLPEICTLIIYSLGKFHGAVDPTDQDQPVKRRGLNLDQTESWANQNTTSVSFSFRKRCQVSQNQKIKCVARETKDKEMLLIL